MIKYIFVTIFAFLSGCTEAGDMKAKDSPCNFSLSFFQKLQKKEEFFALLECIDVNFRIGSAPNKLHDILISEGYSNVDLGSDNPRNYVLNHNNLANSKTQILVYLDNNGLIEGLQVDDFQYFSENSSWIRKAQNIENREIE